MKTSETYLAAANKLHTQIFRLNEQIKPGEFETPAHYAALESILAKTFEELGKTLSADTLTRAAHSLPIIDLNPMDAYPNHEAIVERELDSLVRLIDHVMNLK